MKKPILYLHFTHEGIIPFRYTEDDKVVAEIDPHGEEFLDFGILKNCIGQSLSMIYCEGDKGKPINPVFLYEKVLIGIHEDDKGHKVLEFEGEIPEVTPR